MRSRPTPRRPCLTGRTTTCARCARFARPAKPAPGCIDATPEEIALLGPTSLGLSLFAGGLDWQPGDEVVYHADDYPANVYPWLDLARRGVVPRALQPERPGEITPAVVAAALTPRTRLVALASAYFLTGYRIDVDAIGQMLHERGVLFSLDAIQTLGAFPFSVRHVDFLAADAHKWMLGPLAAGIVYVKRAHFERLRPILLGAANVRSPDFISQGEIRFSDTAARYEPGVLNLGPDPGHGGFARDARERRARSGSRNGSRASGAIGWPGRWANSASSRRGRWRVRTPAAFWRSLIRARTWPQCSRSCRTRGDGFAPARPGTSRVFALVAAFLQYGRGTRSRRGRGAGHVDAHLSVVQALRSGLCERREVKCAWLIIPPFQAAVRSVSAPNVRANVPHCANVPPVPPVSVSTAVISHAGECRTA